MATSGVDLSISGLASGFDWKTVVQQLAQAERAPEAVWSKNQSKISAKNSAFTIITSYLNQVQTAAKALKSTAIYDNRSAVSSAPAVATVAAASGTKVGAYNFNITQLATAAALAGPGDISARINQTDDVRGVTIGTANFASAVTAGTFSVNGASVSIATTDSLQDVFDKISTATGGTVTANYDSSSDTVSMSSSSGNVSLGSAADTSNFLQVAKLYNNNSSGVTSSSALGRVSSSSVLVNARLATAVNDGPNSHVSATNNVSGVIMGAANFGTAVTAGTFSVNGAAVSLAATDSLQDVFDKISTATGGAVTASYNAGTDKISLLNTTLDAQGKPNVITLGGTGDTSNFLAAAKLAGNDSGSVSSTDTVGKNLGEFKLNGVSIAFNALKDSLQTVMDRINGSAAGVTADYDVVNNKFSLTNSVTGDVGISVQDVTGNFLAATGLAGGAITAGTNLNYTVNGGASLVSRSNTIDDSSSGIAGLSVTALTTGAVSATVAGDTSAVAANVQSFVTAYNNLQSYITSSSASTTDSTGKVAAGTLTGDVDAASIASTLRTSTFSPVSISGLSATFSQLANLGIKSNGQNNTVTLDAATLAAALTSNLGDVKKLFSDATGGLAAKLDSLVTKFTGDSGTVIAHQASLAKQSTSIDKQIANLEKSIAADAAHWTQAFRAMETAQAQLTQQLNYLTKNFK